MLSPSVLRWAALPCRGAGGRRGGGVRCRRRASSAGARLLDHDVEGGVLMLSIGSRYGTQAPQQFWALAPRSSSTRRRGHRCA